MIEPALLGVINVAPTIGGVSGVAPDTTEILLPPKGGIRMTGKEGCHSEPIRFTQDRLRVSGVKNLVWRGFVMTSKEELGVIRK